MNPLVSERFSILKKYSRQLSSKPGVYCMVNDKETIVYVGKAKNLRKRVGSYFSKTKNNQKSQAILSATHAINVTITRTEREALILENSLIKEHKPRFNILLKDSKSYPFIEVSLRDEFPRFSFYRGKKDRKGAVYFGPYPNVNALRDTLSQLQKIFRLRNCEESFFNHRSRVCLQHQIKRCSGPCVGMIDKKDYAFNVNQGLEYLRGNNRFVIDEFLKKMDQASNNKEYEKAAFYRDQVSSLKVIQAHQFADGKTPIDLDAVALSYDLDMFCISVLFVRGGRIMGSKNFFPTKTKLAGEAEVLESFLMQYYLEHDVPNEIIINQKIDHLKTIQEVLSEKTNHSVQIKQQVRMDRKQWIKIASTNSQEALTTIFATRSTIRSQLLSLSELLELEDEIIKIECFDISHTTGDKCVAACIAFNSEGFEKKSYRRFNISGITPSDDYAAIKQTVSRHYKRALKENHFLPDIIMIDGGKGQLSVAREALMELGINEIPVIGIAKGIRRKSGEEKIFLDEQKTPLILDKYSPARYLLQKIRDEAHRFAITGHRAKKRKTLLTSDLESIEGIGPVKKKNLIRQFGGIQEVKRASVEDLVTINGINKSLAKRIYNFFNTG
jgi:excinuclease ABC subunit C